MNLLIKSLDTTINVNCDDSAGNDILSSDFISKYIPSVDITVDENTKSSFVLVVKDNNKLSFTLKDNQAFLDGIYKTDYNINDLVTVIDYCLEYKRQQEGIYTVSGSAVSKNGKGILILGSISGLGKTTLALNLCYSQGYKFIGDEKILLQENNIIGGIKTIQFNKAWLDVSIPKDFEQKLSIEDKTTKISLIIQPSISKDSSSLEIEKWDILKTNFHLYEELTRKIRGISRRISNYNYPLVSIDTESISLLRSGFSSKISKSTDAYSIKGNLNDVLEKINSLI